uniref:Uncharacterized protein n=1 Tax=Romanomermis culicivorax TaxID=13658 RepID=A0A915IXD5_ROMCU
LKSFFIFDEQVKRIITLNYIKNRPPWFLWSQQLLVPLQFIFRQSCIMSTAANISKDKKLTPQEVVDGFRKLREEQRQMANKITEFEQEKSEH